MEAEIHLVVRTHGEALPGMIDEQIYTMSGGCNPECIDLQDAIFYPPQT